MTESTVKKSVRLNNDARRSICASILQEFAANFRRTHQLAEPDEYGSYEPLKNAMLRSAMEQVWDDKYGRDVLKTLSELPPALRPTDTSFSVSNEVTKRQMQVTIKGKPGRLASGVDFVLTEEEWEYYFKEWERVCQEVDRLSAETTAFRAEVMAVLDSVNTTKQLLELWPSCEKFIPAHLYNPELGIKLPALHISRLEERLGSFNAEI